MIAVRAGARARRRARWFGLVVAPAAIAITFVRHGRLRRSPRAPTRSTPTTTFIVDPLTLPLHRAGGARRGDAAPLHRRRGRDRLPRRLLEHRRRGAAARGRDRGRLDRHARGRGAAPARDRGDGRRGSARRRGVGARPGADARAPRDRRGRDDAAPQPGRAAARDRPAQRPVAQPGDEVPRVGADLGERGVSADPLATRASTSASSLALAIIAIAWFVLARTATGLRLRAIGLSPEAARFAGHRRRAARCCGRRS